MRRSLLAPFMVTALFLEACCLFYLALFFSAMLYSMGQGMGTVAYDSSSSWFRALACFAAAVAYGRRPDLRPPLQFVSVLAGLYGLYMLFRGNLGHGWDIRHGDVLAVGAWSTVLFVVIGFLGLADYALAHFQRAHRLRGFRA